MSNRVMDPIEAEVDRIRQDIWARIKNMSAEEKDAYYQAQADMLKEEFNIRVSSLKPARPVRAENRRAYQMASVN